MKQAAFLVVIVLLLGCTPGASDAGPSELEPALSAPLTKEEEEMDRDRGKTAVPVETAVPAESTAEPEADDAEAGDVQAVEPVTVDLRQLTPESDATAEPIVQPAPGRPDDPRTRFLDGIVADLSRRLNMSEAEIEIVEVVPVTWSDSSLGCPQPDGMYLQVLTEGYRVTLKAAGKTYAYHTRGLEDFLLCTSGQTNDPITFPPAPEQ